MPPKAPAYPTPAPALPIQRSLTSRWKGHLVVFALATAFSLLTFISPDAVAARETQARAAAGTQKAAVRPRRDARRDARPQRTVRRNAAQRTPTRIEAKRGARARAQPKRAAAPRQAASRPQARSAGRGTAIANPVGSRVFQRAEHATGMSAEVLRRIAERESRLDPHARNPLSSARGLMQFTRDTWLEVVRDFGPRHGLARQAAALTTDRDGTIGARDWKTLQRILKLRDDPQLSATLAAERMKEVGSSLEDSVGRRVRPADLYLVHLLGPTGARRFLTALRKTPSRSSLAVVGQAAAVNPGVFERGGRPLPVSHVYAEVAEMFEPPPERRTQQMLASAAEE